MLKSALAQIIKSQRQSIVIKKRGMKRESLSAIPNATSHAVIISGIRRCGKSTLLHQVIKSRKEKYFFLNFDDPRLFDFEKNDWQKLDEIINEAGCNTLYFDEIQIFIEWERYVRQKLDESFKIFITGSNASLLSRELGTRLTGRHISKELFPFSYQEFLRYKKLHSSAKNVEQYLQLGGFPEYLNSQNPEILSNLLQDILIRDIAVRYGIRDIKTLQKLALYLISNVGNRISGSKLKAQFSFGSTSTVMEYLSHLETSYLLFFVPRFSFSIKSQMVNPKKVYAIDTGLVAVNSGSFNDDFGARFENLIFLFLRRNYSEIYYFAEKKECDFIVCEKGKVKEVIQVCFKLDNDNLEREKNGLFEAMSFLKINKGTIVTLDQKDKFSIGKSIINVIPAHEYLTK